MSDYFSVSYSEWNGCNVLHISNYMCGSKHLVYIVRPEIRKTAKSSNYVGVLNAETTRTTGFYGLRKILVYLV